MLYPNFVSLQKDNKNQCFIASIKVVLRKKKNSKGLYPVAIRVTKNRKSSFLTTGQYIDEKDWDEKKQRIKKSHPNSTRLNNLVAKKLAEANEKLLELESGSKSVTAQSITQEVKAKDVPNSFFDLAEIYIAQLEANGKHNRVGAEKPRIKHFKAFLKNKDISFDEISEVLLKKFQAYLKTNRRVSERTIVNHLIVIRTIFNLAIRENIVDRKFYPFGKGGIVIRFPDSIKIGLSLEEVKALEEVNLDDSIPQNHARNIWLFSFYFAGMRISDVLKIKWSDFKDGRLHYRMGKNKKTLSLKAPTKVLAILKFYEKDKISDKDFVFPELKKADLSSQKDIQRKIATNTKIINKYLRRVTERLDFDKSITTHIARHTFGSISGDRIPVQMLQKLYRHSDITTTINYQKSFIFKDADEALDTVLNS